MALKSILEIDVQDDKFKSFQAQFDTYRQALSGLPEVWGKVADGTSDAGTAFDALAKKHYAMMAAGRLNDQAKAYAAQKMRQFDNDNLTRQQRFIAGLQRADRVAGRMADRFVGMAKSSAKFGLNIASVTTSLLKWGGLIGAVSSLIGSGGLYGITRLAESVAGQRRSNMGTGVGYGQQRAFGLDYGRFVSAESMLGNVSAALSDKTSAGYTGLLGAGISSRYADTHNAADVSAELLHRLPEIFKGVAPSLVGAVAEARGLTSILSVEDIKRYLAASPEERRAQDEAYKRDSKGLDVDAETSRKWADLNTQLDRAKAEIETVFVSGLVPLAGPIGDLSKGVTDLATAFLKSDVVKSGIEGLAGGLEDAAKFIGTQEFKDDVKLFVDDVGQMAKAIADAYKWFAGLFGNKKPGIVDPDDAKQSALAAFDPANDPATHGKGIWNRGCNKGKHGHATLREGYNGDEFSKRVRDKERALNEGRMGLGTDVKSRVDIAEIAKATGEMRDLMKSGRDGAGAFGGVTESSGGIGGSGRHFGGGAGAGASLGDHVFGRRGGGGGAHGGGGVGGGADVGGRASRMTGDVAARAKAAMARLEAKGWTHEAAAAAIGNAQQESGVRSDGPLGDTARFGFGDNAAHGMFQWRGQRFRDLKKFAEARGKSWQDFDTQIDFFDEESKKYGSAEWRKSHDIVNANRGMKRFEGYGDNTFGGRLANARQLAAGKNDGGIYPSSSDGLGRPALSGRAVTDAEVFAARQRILNGSRDPKDRALVERYKAGQASPEGDALHQHVRNLKLVLAARQHRLDPMHHTFRAAVQAARSAAGIAKAREEGERGTTSDGRKTSGLDLDQYHRNPMPHVRISNATGASVTQSAGPASYG